MTGFPNIPCVYQKDSIQMEEYSPNERIYIKHRIEKRVKEKFGWVVDFFLEKDGRFHWNVVHGNDRYDLYPDMAKEEADRSLIEDLDKIFKEEMPNSQIFNYEQSGKIQHF